MNLDLLKYEKETNDILTISETLNKVDNDKLKQNFLKIKKSKNKKTREDLLETLAIACQLSKRILHITPYKVQIMGALTLFDGKIAEMKTGEGKTLTSLLAILCFNAFNKHIHVVTTNEYLSERDSKEFEEVYNFLEIKVGLNSSKKTSTQKKEAYNSEVLYSTNDELGFDYLRDNTTYNKNKIVQNKLDVVLIDEIDSILIDSSRTPLIIAEKSKNDNFVLLIQSQVFCEKLNKEDYNLDKENKNIVLTDKGLEKANSFFKKQNILSKENIEYMHYISNALKANFVFKKDVDYSVKNGKVEIIDTFTGRISKGRRFSDDLHQAIEQKEKVEIEQGTVTKATITYQNYFRMYNKICGMSGTAKEEEFEFNNVYNTKVVKIPTRKEIIRTDMQDKFFETKKEKLDYLVSEIKYQHNSFKRPILICTHSVAESELLSQRLRKVGLKHNVLNAVKSDKENHIVEQAGKIGAITISTNMMGRGTDIKLEDRNDELHSLFVFSTERSSNKRIDNQLKGRSGRQGDFGATQFLVSLEDDIFEKYADKKTIKKMTKYIRKHNYKKCEQIVDSLQKYIEAKEQSNRQSSLRHDIIIGKQRKTVYDLRKQILENNDVLTSFIDKSLDNSMKRIIENAKLLKNNPKELSEQMHLFGLSTVNKKELNNIFTKYKKIVKNKIYNEKSFEEDIKIFVIATIDFYFEKQIMLLEDSKHYTNVRSSAQLNPLIEFQKNSILLFKKMKEDIENNITFNLINKLGGEIQREQ